MLTAIEDGLYEPAHEGAPGGAAGREGQTSRQMRPEPAEADLQVLLHPRLPDLYRRKVEALERVLDGPDRAEAMDLIRSMIERVELRPRADGDKGLDAVLFGDLAAILAASAGADKQKLPGAGGPPGSQLSVVAGTRNQAHEQPGRKFACAGATTRVETARLQVAGFGAAVLVHACRHLQHFHHSPSPHLRPNAPALSSRGVLGMARCGWCGA